MNRTIYDKNKAFMENIFPGISDRFEEYLQKDSEEIGVFTSADGKRGLFIRAGEGVIQLNSKYSLKAYADIWAENIIAREQLSRNHVLFMFGFGNGEYVKALADRMPKESILICYEPSVSIFMKAMQEVDIQEIKQGVAIVFVENLNMEYFASNWKEAVTTANGTLVHMAVHPNYVNLFSEQFQNILEEIQKLNQMSLVEQNTIVRFSNTPAENEIALLPYLAESYNLAQLFKSLPSGVPAIIVAAGPSLSKNIKEIKNAKNRALIIAIDTSVKLLLEEGIIPDIYITVDARKPLTLFSDDRIHDIPVCVVPYAVPEAFEKQRSRVFVSLGATYCGRICQQMGKELGFLGNGGTVAHDAFVLAVEAGMSPIILVGQDLAYTGEQTHAKGVAYGVAITGEEEEETIWVEDIYGKPVRTIVNLNLYKEWYENQIKMVTGPKNIRVIDATEGGAKIEGTEIKRLKDVIEEECTKEYDFKSIINAVPQLFNQQEKAQLRQQMEELPARMQQMQEMVEKTVEIYQTIYKNSENMEPDHLQKSLFELKELSDKIEQHYDYLLVEPYAAEAARDAMQDLDNETEDLADDMKETARRGLLLAEALAEAFPKVMEKINQMLRK